MYSVYGDGICIYNDLYLAGAVNATTPKLKLADNTAGTFEITLPVGNAGYNLLERLSSEIVVKRNDTEIWSGRIIGEKVNFQNSRILTCEGELAYLNDTTQSPTEYDNVEIYDFLLSVIAEHNSKVGSDKQFTLGAVTVNESIYYVTNNENTMSLITDVLLNSYGGHIRVRKEDGIRYLDYLSDYPNTSAQEIRFGVNLLDFAKNWDMTEIATVIRPRGAKINDMSTSQLEDAGYTENEIEELRTLSEKVDICLDVTKANLGSPYVTNEDGVSSFGWIEAVVDWDGITDPSELLEKAQTYLSEEQFDDMVIEVSAVDLRYLSQEVQSINLLDTVRCVSHPHGMDRTFPVSELNIQLDKPDNSTYTLGDKVNGTFTGSSRAANAEILDKISKIPNEKTILDKAQENASQILNLATNGYITITRNDYGSQEFYISNTQQLVDATKHWRWNMNGLGFWNGERDRYNNKIYLTSITSDGAIVADRITTGTLSSILLKSGDGNTSWNLSNSNITIGSTVYRAGEFTMKRGSIDLGTSSAYSGGAFHVDDYGYLRAEYGLIGGFNITAHSIYNDGLNMNSQGFSLYKDGDLLGEYGTQYWVLQPTSKGLSVSMEHNTAYITWSYLNNTSDDIYTIKLMYASDDLPDDDGGTFVADRIHLGTYLQLDHWGFEYVYNSSTYNSMTVVTSSSSEKPKRVSLPFNLERSGSSLSWEYIDCYICNGVIMS